MTTASGSLTASSLGHSVEVNQVEDENNHIHDSSPLNVSLFIKSLDGCDDDHMEFIGGSRPRSSSIININNNSLDEETDEDECSMTYESISNHMLCNWPGAIWPSVSVGTGPICCFALPSLCHCTISFRAALCALYWCRFLLVPYMYPTSCSLYCIGLSCGGPCSICIS
jgi:hypothetical protein